MGFLINIGIFPLLITAISARSVWLERNIANLSEIEERKSDCDCEWRYLKHYETKGCWVESADECGCPKKFICPANQSTENNSKVCKYQNKEYNVGAKIITSEACQICRCREDDDGIPFISCISRECPPPEVPKDRNCHLVYRAGKCCPTGYECVSEDIEETPESKVCEYNGRLYPFRAKIYPSDDPCQICECNENWDGVRNKSCHQQECIFERNKAQLDAGCIPVYHENRCCPIEFYCSPSHNLSYALLENDGTFDEDSVESGDQCVFAGQFYNIGVELSINSTCIKCQCQIPPDFTCVHQSCPPPPNAADCYAHYNPEQCCPQYDCLLEDEEVISEISDSDIEDGCPTPLCADSSCHIEVPPGHQCPTCICKLTPVPDQSISLPEQKQVREVETDQFFEDDVDDFDDYLFETVSKDSPDSDYSEAVMENNAQMKLDDDERSYDDTIKNDENDEVIDSKNSENLKVEEDSESEMVSFPLPLPEDSIETNAQTLYENEIEIANDVLSSGNESFNDDSNQLQRVIQKRSQNTEVNSVGAVVASNSISVTPFSQQQHIFQQGQIINQHHEYNEDIEREGGASEEDNDGFDAELESIHEKGPDSDQNLGNKITVSGQENESSSVQSSTEHVPDGCPTPICANSTCRITIPPGHQCPTCICKGDYDRQP